MLRNCTVSLEFMVLQWCRGEGSNLHDGIPRRGILSPLCLPVSPPGRKAWIVSERNWERARSSPVGGGGRNRTGVHGFAGRCITTLPPRREPWESARFKQKGKPVAGFPRESGAAEESRTLDLNLGKVALYQLSYCRAVANNYTVNTKGNACCRRSTGVRLIGSPPRVNPTPP